MESILSIKTLLEGKKFHLLVILYVCLVLFVGAESPDGTGLDVSNITPETIKDALLGLMGSAAKAAFSRFTEKEVIATIVEGE